MNPRTWLMAIMVLAMAAGLWACGDDDDTGDGGDADTDADADTDTDTDTDGSVWCDDATDLCWQEPPPNDIYTRFNAISYCDNLDLGGHTDWRLPNIDELITLLRGCVDGTETGDLSPSICEMTPAGCAETDSCNGKSTCSWCEWDPPNGPGSGGCYWGLALSGTCSWYWSSSSSAYGSGRAWFVSFGGGNVSNVDKYTAGHARCVRGGP